MVVVIDIERVPFLLLFFLGGEEGGKQYAYPIQSYESSFGPANGDKQEQ